MGCSQSKSADVSNVNATTSVAKTVEPKMKELKTEELEIEELQKQDKEPVDETLKTLEPTSLVIDTLVTEQQVPDLSAVDVPDSVRANFSSFNISFIDPTVSAPTSATTEPNVASLRVAVITEETVNKDMDETLRVEAAVKEVEPNVAKSLANTNTEEIAAEQAELEKIEEQVEELSCDY
ncbi:unnamed protein product [Peronospora destructor]|uniref:Uncharacterized protein n=1 Tax=Peronospora destructor TaxID=86335 RepID=A0AAV0V3K3_9STRA|nr:unnamed protein product [Peronospora destructor]